MICKYKRFLSIVLCLILYANISIVSNAQENNVVVREDCYG